MSAVSALLTVTSTMPASAKMEGFSDNANWSRAIGLLEAVEARQPQAAGLDLGDHARPRQQRDATAAGRQHAADEAADAARPCDPDRSIRNHFVTYRVAHGSR